MLYSIKLKNNLLFTCVYKKVFVHCIKFKTYIMKPLEKVLEEINEYADTIKYDDIKKDYIIAELKREYSDLYFNSKLIIMDLQTKNKLLQIKI